MTGTQFPPAESLALAVLRGGCSYDDAATQSGLSVEAVMALYREVNRQASEPQPDDAGA